MCNMNTADTALLIISPLDAQPGDVVVDGPYGTRTVIGAFRPNWTDFESPVRSLSHMETSKPEVRTEDSITFALVGGEIDFFYDLDSTITVRRSL